MLWRHSFEAEFSRGYIAEVIIEIVDVVLELLRGFFEKLDIGGMKHLRPPTPFMHYTEILLGIQKQFEHFRGPFILRLVLDPVVVVKLSLLNFRNFF